MNDRMIQDLVDSYLLNQISADDKAMLLDMMEADPVFAQYVKECEETFNVLQAARDRELREKLKTWDVEAKTSKRGSGKGLLIFLLFVFVLVSFWCWLSFHFSPAILAMHSFKATYENEIRFAGTSTVDKAWKEGIEAFNKEDFEKAMLEFMSIPPTNDKTKMINVQWNILLCQLALNGPSNKWLDDINAISKTAPEPIHSHAEKLFRQIHSPLYINLYSGILHKTFTSIKPKII